MHDFTTAVQGTLQRIRVELKSSCVALGCLTRSCHHDSP